MDFGKYNEKELLRIQASVVNELQHRGVVRTKNNPLGDYTEWLVANSLQLELEANSKAGYDGTDKNGARYQIKGRRVTAKNKSRQLGVIRNYESKDFDILIAVIYNEDFNVIEAVSIPHEVISSYARFTKHANGHMLILKGAILDDPRITFIKHLFES